MATVSLDPTYPHVLRAVGDNLLDGNGNLDSIALRDLLLGSVGFCGHGLRGNCDFLVGFVPGGSRDSYSGDVDNGLRPRRFRGVVQMRTNFTSSAAFDVRNKLFILAQEIGHYWLVPKGMRLTSGGQTAVIPTEQDAWTALNDGEFLPSFPILGRQDSHWSSYIDSENSPMDGVNHQVLGEGPWGDIVECVNTAGPTITLPDLGSIAISGNYSNLERWIMGDPAPGADILSGRFALTEPRWTEGLPCHAGLFLELTGGTRWFVGFINGLMHIAASTTDGLTSSPIMSLPSDYAPTDNLSVRVVADAGGQLHFQARLWRGRSFTGCLGALWTAKRTITPEMLFMDLAGGLSSAGSLEDGWTTLATTAGVASRLGIGIRATDDTRAMFARLAARSALRFQSGTIESVDSSALSPDFPKPGPKRLGNGDLILPYRIDSVEGVQKYVEDGVSADAPKLVLTAPSSATFSAFATTISLEMLVTSNRPGKDALGDIQRGRRRTVRFRDIDLPWSDTDRAIRQEQPSEDTYNVVFVAVGKTNADITASRMQRIDEIRRAWEPYYQSMMTTRRCRTTLPTYYGRRIFERPTTFGNETNGTWLLTPFGTSPSPALVYIKTASTPSGHVEVHVASASSEYQTRIFESPTTFLNENNGTWLLADYDADGEPDLVYIKHANTPSGRVEVHVASGASAFQRRIFSSPTIFGNESNGRWLLADVDGDGIPDLVYIKYASTGTGFVEVHAASGASGFQARIMAQPSTFATEANGVWLLTDLDRDGVPDLAYIKTSNTPSGMVEVHFASGSSQFQTRIFERETTFVNEMNGDWTMTDFDGDGYPDLAYIKTSNTPAGLVEVHVAAAC